MSLIPKNTLFDFDQFFDQFFAPVKGSDKESFFTPRIDVKEKEDHYEVSAELPGVKKEDIHITLNNGILSIEAESKQEDKEEKDGKIIRQERRYGKFVRSFSVGSGVKDSDIKAGFDNGILTLQAPKRDNGESTSTQRIEIQ